MPRPGAGGWLVVTMSSRPSPSAHSGGLHGVGHSAIGEPPGSTGGMGRCRICSDGLVGACGNHPPRSWSGRRCGLAGSSSGWPELRRRRGRRQPPHRQERHPPRRPAGCRLHPVHGPVRLGAGGLLGAAGPIPGGLPRDGLAAAGVEPVQRRGVHGQVDGAAGSHARPRVDLAVHRLSPAPIRPRSRSAPGTRLAIGQPAASRDSRLHGERPFRLPVSGNPRMAASGRRRRRLTATPCAPGSAMLPLAAATDQETVATCRRVFRSAGPPASTDGTSSQQPRTGRGRTPWVAAWPMREMLPGRRGGEQR
jgi:hypothetical protein